MLTEVVPTPGLCPPLDYVHPWIVSTPGLCPFLDCAHPWIVPTPGLCPPLDCALVVLISRCLVNPLGHALVKYHTLAAPQAEEERGDRPLLPLLLLPHPFQLYLWDSASIVKTIKEAFCYK